MIEKIDVAKILVERNGEFLVVQKNSNYDWKADKWELPGGKIESNENLDESAIRELKEETGLKSQDFRKVVRVEVEKEQCVNCEILYTKTASGNLELSEEHKDYRWVTPREFREMDWHRDAGYAIPAMKYLEQYLNKK